MWISHRGAQELEESYAVRIMRDLSEYNLSPVGKYIFSNFLKFCKTQFAVLFLKTFLSHGGKGKIELRLNFEKLSYFCHIFTI